MLPGSPSDCAGLIQLATDRSRRLAPAGARGSATRPAVAGPGLEELHEVALDWDQRGSEHQCGERGSASAWCVWGESLRAHVGGRGRARVCIGLGLTAAGRDALPVAGQSCAQGPIASSVTE
jgi:hypothetical protein